MVRKPQVGILYCSWFDAYDPGDKKCDGIGWKEENGSLRPFSWPDRPTSDPSHFGLPAKSFCFWNGGQGECYSSLNPGTAEVHAAFLEELGIDFVVYDVTNRVKWCFPCPEYNGAIAAIEGFRTFRAKGWRAIRSVFMLSLTNAVDGNEVFVFNKTIKNHITDIANRFVRSPDDYLSVFGKPLLLFYVSAGENVKSEDLSGPAFHGPGNIVPTTSEFDYNITLDNGQTHSIHDFFTVRYALAAFSPRDYELLTHQAWMFSCLSDGYPIPDQPLFSRFSEVAYASVLSGGTNGPGRDIDLFNRFVNLALERDKQFLLIRHWNEFSVGGDEPFPFAYTLEPNTELYKYDTTPGNSDAYYFFYAVKARLNRILIVNRHNFSSDVQPTRVLVGDPAVGGNNVAHEPFGGANYQKWTVRPTGDGYVWLINVETVKPNQMYRVVDVDGNNAIHAPQDHSRISQHWKIVPQSGGWVKVVNRAYEQTDYVLEGDPNGTNVQIGPYGGFDHQQWRIENIWLS